MTNLWHKRWQKHFRFYSKYMSKIINDHLVILLLFLIGVFGYFYSQFLASPSVSNTDPLLFLSLGLITSLFVSSIATFFEEADRVFLRPQSSGLSGYLIKAIAYSLVMPAFVALLLVFSFIPWVTQTTGLVTIDFVILFFTFVLTRLALFVNDWKSLYLGKANTFEIWLLRLCALATILIAVNYHNLAGLGISLLLVVFQLVTYQAQRRHDTIDLLKAIELENKRESRALRLLSVFVDVPKLPSKISKRLLLELVTEKFPVFDQSPYSYLLWRYFIRTSDYWNNLVWLSLVLGLAAFLMEGWLLRVALLIFLSVLSLIQLIPLYESFGKSGQWLYLQINHEKLVRDFSRMLTAILEGQLLLLIVILSARHFSLPFIATMASYCIFLAFYIQKVLPGRLIKTVIKRAN